MDHGGLEGVLPLNYPGSLAGPKDGTRTRVSLFAGALPLSQTPGFPMGVVGIEPTPPAALCPAGELNSATSLRRRKSGSAGQG